CHRDFWPAMHKNLLHRLSASTLHTKWKIDFFNKSKGSALNSWIGCSFQDNASKIKPTIQQGSSQFNYRLELGLKRHFEIDDWTALPEVIRFQKTAAKWGYAPHTGHWLVLKELPYRPRGQNFTLRMCNEPEQFVDELADEVWFLFTHLEPLIDAANKQLHQLEG
ncbi:MAG: hypothetical protein KDE51_13020, partial [Anaerolineales bacterium]|nr:hypothetical protein [Anaerolineales bacterium]